ncbi:MAG: MFS transporter [Firmicutes bacterium]|nr:MFS transporter [Bacillota bacterium]
MTGDRIFTLRFWLSFGALFCSAMVMYSLVATITQYVSEMGSTALLAGMVSGIYIFGGMISRLYSGGALERVGWKKIALIFVALHAGACFFYFFVHNVALLLLVRFIHGVGFGASSNALMTIGMSVLPRKRFAEGCGYLMLSTTLAVGIGPLFGGLVYDRFGGTGCFTAATVMCVLMLLLTLPLDIRDIDPAVRRKLDPEGIRRPLDEAVSPLKRAGTGSWVQRFIEVRAVPISLVTGLTALGYVAIMSFYRIFSVQTHLERPFALFFIIYSGVLLFTRPMAGRLQDRYGDRIVCIPGILAQTAGIFLLAFWPNAFTVVLCAVTCGLGYGTLSSACNAIACRHTSIERRSYAVSTFYICCDVGMGIGPMLLGGIISLSGSYTTMYYFAAAATLASLPLCLWALRKRR